MFRKFYQSYILLVHLGESSISHTEHTTLQNDPGRTCFMTYSSIKGSPMKFAIIWHFFKSVRNLPLHFNMSWLTKEIELSIWHFPLVVYFIIWA